VAQLVALYRFDVLDADPILEWWRLLKEPEGVFGHSGGLRSMVRRHTGVVAILILVYFSRCRING